MIQTYVFISHLNGENLDIVPKVIINPKGSDAISVTANMIRFS